MRVLIFFLLLGGIQCLFGSCSNRCGKCATDGSKEWCLECFKGTHVVPTQKSGYCEGFESPIKNCLITQSIQGVNVCLKCEIGYGMLKETDASTYTNTCLKIEDQSVTRAFFLNSPDKPVLKPTFCKEGFKIVSDKCVPLGDGDNMIHTANCELYSYDADSKISKCVKCSSTTVFYRGRVHPTGGSSLDRLFCIPTKSYASACESGRLLYGRYCDGGCNYEGGYYSEGVGTRWSLLPEDEDLELQTHAFKGQICTNGKNTVGSGSGSFGRILMFNLIGLVGLIVLFNT